MKTKTIATKKKREEEKLRRTIEKETNSDRKKRAKFAVFSISMDSALQFEKFEKRIVASSFDNYVHFQT